MARVRLYVHLFLYAFIPCLDYSYSCHGQAMVGVVNSTILSEAKMVEQLLQNAAENVVAVNLRKQCS